jgi:hypothetical protein
VVSTDPLSVGMVSLRLKAANQYPWDQDWS